MRSLPTGTERISVRGEIADLYRAGSTIRSIATRTGHSYWAVRTLLLEAGVQLRDRGGRLRKAAV
jgi:hypothetical protein